jgi:predicted PurR-regulated permease PerM
LPRDLWLARTVHLLLLGAALYLTYRVIQPYLDSIILAGLLALISYPVHGRILRLVRGRRVVAALLSCLLLMVLVVLPLGLMGVALTRQGVRSFTLIQGWLLDGGVEQLAQSPAVTGTLSFLEQQLQISRADLPDVRETLVALSGEIGQFLIRIGGSLVQDVSTLVLDFVLMLFVLFYLLLEGERLRGRLQHLLPLSQSHEEQLVARVRAVARSALLGSLGTASAQAVVGAIGLLIVGIPALFWGVAMGFASLVPVVGTALIWVPACLYLLAIGSWGKALFLALWCIVLVGSVDNLLRPILMKGEAGMPTLWLFFAILGGIQYFGLIGLVYGPMVFGLCAVLLYIYELEFQELLDHLDRR